MEDKPIIITLHHLPEKDFQLLDFVISSGVLDHRLLPTIELPQGIDFTKGIIISGKGPVWLYAHLTHLCHVAAWVATADPRLGAIVVQNHIPNGRTVGSTIGTEEFSGHIQLPTKPAKQQRHAQTEANVIALVGPFHSGKSVLLNALKRRIQADYSDIFASEFFIIRACPDGEGDWFGDIPEEQGKLWRYATRFTPSFVDGVVNGIRNSKKTKRILLVDCGGIIDKINQRIFNECTGAIIISSQLEEIPHWRGALRASEVEVMAEIHSVLQDSMKFISRSPLQLIMGRFERSEVKAAAERLPDELIQKLIE